MRKLGKRVNARETIEAYMTVSYCACICIPAVYKAEDRVRLEE